jgi:hypothetical protein
MADQIVLAWTVDVTNTTFSAAQASDVLAAVPLYENEATDPVLGQFFGLTVANDVSTTSGTTATRTLTLNMTSTHSPTAPPPFPCNPRTSAPPDLSLSYPLLQAVTLPGSFFVSPGTTIIPTTASQIPSLVPTDGGTGLPTIQFLSQEGVFYGITTVGATSITLTSPYTGAPGNTGAFKEVVAPVTIAAVYSTSDLDTDGVATTPAIPAGSGARAVGLVYKDSLGATGTVAVPLTGKRPATVVLEGGTIDIAEIVEFFIVPVTGVGGFGNSVGQITLVGLSAPLPPVLSNRTPFDFRALTDEAQGLINRCLAYLPPSYFSLAQQNASAPQLGGDFMVTTGSTSVPTSQNQVGILAPGYIIRFAAGYQNNVQLPVESDYVIATVGPKLIALTTPYIGIDDTNTGINNIPVNNTGSKGIVGTKVSLRPTGATLISPSPAAPPSSAQLAGPLAQFVALETAAPPLNPPLEPMTVPTPTFLSGYFTRTIQLALAGVPVVAQPITFA